MDDFEILDESPVDLVREADVLMLKKRKTVQVLPTVGQTLKRKLETEDLDLFSLNAKRRKILNKAASSSSSSSSSSDSDTSTSSSSPSSSSSSSSSSDSDSSSSTGPTPSVTPAKVKRLLDNVGAPAVVNGCPTPSAAVQQGLVPPGFGKPSTQARNKRRKIKRMITAGKVTPAAAASFTVDADRTGHQEDETTPNPPYDEPTPETIPTALTLNPTLSSLGNRNKRKGFKKSMEGIVPQRLVFDAASFVPPSEREVLPPNIFVTSVEVEWRTGRGRQNEVDEVEAELAPETTLPQVGDELESQRIINWTVVEETWTTYPRVEATSILNSGDIVAWRGFGLDPWTLTPQASLLHLGEVIMKDSGSLIISPLVRPGIGPASFGRAHVTEDQQQDDSAEHLSTPLAEIWSSDWRVLRTK